MSLRVELGGLGGCYYASCHGASLLTEPISVSADRWHFVIPLRPSACLLHLVSWLLVAFIPGLLMLATFGLDRLEAGLEGDTVSPADVTAFLEQAKADCAKPAARTSEVQTYELLDDGDDRDYSKRPPAAGRGVCSTINRIRNFSRLATPIVCSVGTSRSRLPLD